jgi:hypothetical protein
VAVVLRTAVVGEHHKAVEVARRKAAVEEAGCNHLEEDMENGREEGILRQIISSSFCNIPAVYTYVLVEGHRMGPVVVHHMAAVEEVGCNHLEGDIENWREEGILCQISSSFCTIPAVSTYVLVEGHRMGLVVVHPHMVVAEEAGHTRLEVGSLAVEDILYSTSLAIPAHHEHCILTTRRGLAVATVGLLICHRRSYRFLMNDEAVQKWLM